MSVASALIRGVFRQARASGLTAALLTVTAIAAIACGTIRIGETADGIQLALGFGAIPVTTGATTPEAVAHWQFILAAVIADTAGVLLALSWTAGFLPSFLDPSAVSVLLAKPASRLTMFLSRWLGVVLLLSVQAVIFVGATWLATALTTGVWTWNYWISVPILIAHFSVFYAFSALLAVSLRNTVVCIVGSILFWVLCCGMNYGRHALAGVTLPEASVVLAWIVDFGYWLLPKPADFSLILTDQLNAEKFAPPWVAFRAMRDAGQFHPWLSVISSLASGAAILALAAYEFVNDEY